MSGLCLLATLPARDTAPPLLLLCGGDLTTPTPDNTYLTLGELIVTQLTRALVIQASHFEAMRMRVRTVGTFKLTLQLQGKSIQHSHIDL